MQTMTKKMLVVGLGLAVCTPVAFAAKPGTPTLGDVLEASGVSLTGYVDTSYTYLSGSGLFTSGTANRVFDTERNSFNLHMLNLTASSLPAAGFGGLVDLGMGSDAKVITPFGTTNDEFDITQAYVNYASGKFTLNIGKFVTSSGAEVIKSPDNPNFSRGILFGYAIPFTHTGVRTSYALSDSTKFILGVNNGWDNLKDTNLQKTIELGASLAPAKILSLTAAIYSGDEQVGAVQGRRDLVDVVATFNLSDALSFVVNSDVAKQEIGSGVGSTEAKWSGVAGYINYKFNPKWRAALRAENFDDKDGFRTGLVQKWKEATLTVAYMPSKNAELRAEVRGDSSDMDAFVQPDGTVKKTQQSVGLEAIYKF